MHKQPNPLLQLPMHRHKYKLKYLDHLSRLNYTINIITEA